MQVMQILTGYKHFMNKNILITISIIIFLTIAGILAFKFFMPSKIITLPGKAIFNEAIQDTNNIGI